MNVPSGSSASRPVLPFALAAVAAVTLSGSIASAGPFAPRIGGLPRVTEVALPELPLTIAANDGQVVRVSDMAGTGRTGLLPSVNDIRVSSLVSEGGDILTLARSGIVLRQDKLQGNWALVRVGQTSTAVAYDGQRRLVGARCSSGDIYRVEFGGSLTRYGTRGAGPGQFECPEGIAVDPQGRIYVADVNRVVRVDDLSGAGWITFGRHGSGMGEVNLTRSITLDSRGRIYFVDFFNRRVVRMDDMTGRGWVTYATDVGEPAGVTVDSYSRVYIADPVGDRVIRIDDMGGKNRKDLRFNRRATDGTALAGPAAVYVSPPAGVAVSGPIR